MNAIAAARRDGGRDRIDASREPLRSESGKLEVIRAQDDVAAIALREQEEALLRQLESAVSTFKVPRASVHGRHEDHKADDRDAVRDDQMPRLLLDARRMP